MVSNIQTSRWHCRIVHDCTFVIGTDEIFLKAHRGVARKFRHISARAGTSAVTAPLRSAPEHAPERSAAERGAEQKFENYLERGAERIKITGAWNGAEQIFLKARSAERSEIFYQVTALAGTMILV